MCINVDDSDMEMLTEDDFIEEDLPPESELRFPPNRNHVLYFIQSVKLTEIMGVVLSRQYSAASRKAQQHQSLDLTHSDMALANWLMSLPPEMQYRCSKSVKEQNFWAAFLHMTYYTVLCLLHRPHLKPSIRQDAAPQAYPSRNIAFTAANMITRILEDVVHFGNLEILPSFSTYAIFSAMIFHSFEIRSPNAAVVEAAHKKLRFCQKSLAELSKVWLVATSIVTLFDAISESKTLQDRLTKTAIQGSGPARAQESRKRRAMDSMSESRKLSANTRYEKKSPDMMAAPAHAVKQDAMLTSWSPSASDTSATRTNTIPAGLQTPPEFYFSTQQQIPHTFFESYQPGFLFPQEAVGNSFNAMSEGQASSDAMFIQNTPNPALETPQLQSPGGTWSTSTAMDYINPLPFANSAELDFEAMQGDLLHYPESEASNEGRAVPPESLNVAEWYSFLGINGNGT
ncbi:hypothetical protein MRB53_039069 [Persea americana]|nr:hypothetical protein MRB53_039069 [Persea americana]